MFTLIIIGILSIYTVLKILPEWFFFFPISFFNPETSGEANKVIFSVFLVIKRNLF
ncbi:hypothetical protein M784_09825 [Neisseria gonorrhoeae MU_NG19]|nr:hypothetical protein M719_02940 [Neisseria gonorrhoeae SK36809]KLS82246.1 hypothetical protein M777_10195 [Neisseria gonorrhoeae MU_NG8]KLS96547.1 hypothetical protein M784_09825 [Neisseria gonorrhoeae MU_NG19]